MEISGWDVDCDKMVRLHYKVLNDFTETREGEYAQLSEVCKTKWKRNANEALYTVVANVTFHSCLIKKSDTAIHVLCRY